MPKDRKAKAKKAYQKEQRAAEQRKAHEKIQRDYYIELFSLLDKLGVKEHVKLFPLVDLVICFKFRTSTLIFDQVGSRTPTLELEEVSKALLQAYMKSQTYTYTNGAVITAYEVFHILESFRYLVGFKVRNAEPNHEEIKAKLWELKEFIDTCLADVQQTIRIWLRIIGWIVSIPDKENILFRTEIEVGNKKQDHSLNYSYTRKFKIFYEVVPVERKVVLVEGGRRPCYRFQVGNVDGQIVNLAIKRELFGFKGTPVSVYLQVHALNRLAERIDTQIIGITLGMCIAELIKNPVVHDEGEGRYLIDVLIDGIKVGYFVANLVEGILLIKTFLFITNSTTPEGEKLDKLSGMVKLDKQYLGIDKLSTFFSLNPNESAELKRVLGLAGLSHLLKVKNGVFGFLAKLVPSKRYTDNSSAIQNYFKRREELPSLSDLKDECILPESEKSSV